jgi:hypothetical protein
MNRRFGIRTIHPIVDLIPKETVAQGIERAVWSATRSFLAGVGIFKSLFAVMAIFIGYFLIMGLDAVGGSTGLLTVGERTILILLILLFIAVMLKSIMEWMDSIIRIVIGVR